MLLYLFGVLRPSERTGILTTVRKTPKTYNSAQNTKNLQQCAKHQKLTTVHKTPSTYNSVQNAKNLQQCAKHQ
jgi:hypothetical protein